MARRGRLTYSTECGTMCPRCGQPERRCSCSQSAAPEEVPDQLAVSLRLDKKGRRGKTLTMIEGLPANPSFLRSLAKELKARCGTGGTHGARHIEMQGDQRAALRAELTRRGWTVKG